MKDRMQGYVEAINTTSIKGWAWDNAAGNTPRIRALLAAKVVGEAAPGLQRTDVCRALKIPETETVGFLIPVALSNSDIEQVLVQASPDGQTWFDLKKITSRKSSGSYQDFDGDGASKSGAKLAALMLDQLNKGQPSSIPPLNGKRVLDIGCNEGFFCAEAVKQGAARVLGIDSVSKWIELARSRVPNAEFINASWWNIPDEKFDIIFFLSAIHYEPEQKKLLQKLAQHLTKDGVLILECGVKGSGKKQWHIVHRWDGPRRYPSLELLRDDLLADYGVRGIGPSVQQAGDPVPRYVFHCRPRAPVAMIIAGLSHSGKSSLAQSLAGKGLAHYDSDSAISKLLADKAYAMMPIAAALLKVFGEGYPKNIALVGNYISDNGLADDFCEFISKEIPIESGLFCIEGEIFRHNTVQSALFSKLDALGVRSWLVQSTKGN